MYTGNEREEYAHTHGVGLLLSKDTAKSLIEWEPVSERIITARFTSNGRNITIIHCYAPTNSAEFEEKETFYQHLQTVTQKLPKRYIQVVMGDMNAKIGKDNDNWKGTMGKEGLGQMNENGLLFADFYTLNELIIGGTLFPHKPTHKSTWISPDLQTENQIDHITITKKWRRVLLDVRVKRGADINSDHHLLVGEFRMELAAKKKTDNKVQRRFEIRKRQNTKTRQELGITLQNRFQTLEEGKNIDEKWTRCKNAITDTCEQVLGCWEARRKDWITDDTWEDIEARRETKMKLNKEADDTREKNCSRNTRKETKQLKRRQRGTRKHMSKN